MDDYSSVALVVRDLGAAWRALRLYPPSSPMPAQAANAACKAVSDHLDSEPSLKLVVVREGFLLRGVDRVFTAPGVPDLADALGAHSIAEITFVAPPAPEEALAFIAAAREQPQAIQARGGLQSVLDAENVASIRLVPVALANAEAPLEIPEDEADTFLARLAADPTRLASWLRSLLTYDDEGLAEGLGELAAAVGDVTVFGASLARAFLELEQDCTDRLLEVSMDLEAVRPITAVMLANLSTVELTAALRGGRYGKNPLSLSWALTRLPLQERSDALIEETATALLSADASEERVALMRHLVATRRLTGVEPALVDAQPTYLLALDATRLKPEHLEYLRRAAEARRSPDAACVGTILHLLELAEGFEPFCRVVDALVRTVPHLLEQGDPELALLIVRKLARGELASEKPWPELDGYLLRSLQEACGSRSMAVVLARFGSGEQGVECAKELVTLGGERAALGLAEAVMVSEDETHMSCAQAVLGRRLPEILAQRIQHAEARNAGRLAALFAADGSPASMQALQHLAVHPEDRVRAEAARGVCTGGGEVVARFIPRLLRDDAREVALVAARTVARRGDEQATQILAARLAEFDDDKDLHVAREIINALAASPSQAAADALKSFAEGGAFLRKRKSAEMRGLAKRALQGRQGGAA